MPPRTTVRTDEVAKTDSAVVMIVRGVARRPHTMGLGVDIATMIVETTKHYGVTEETHVAAVRADIGTGIGAAVVPMTERDLLGSQVGN